MERNENFREMMEEIANLSQLWNVKLMCSDGFIRNVVTLKTVLYNQNSYLANLSYTNLSFGSPG